MNKKTNQQYQIPDKVLRRKTEKGPFYLATLGVTNDLVHSNFKCYGGAKVKWKWLKRMFSSVTFTFLI